MKEARQVIEQAANVVDQVKRSSSLNLISTNYRALCIVSEHQLRENIHRWLSPPDPSTNHNIACGTHNKKSATWFFEGKIYQEWKSKGSLLWVHGKHAPSLNIPYNSLNDPLILQPARARVFFGSCVFGSTHHRLPMSFVSSTIIEDIKSLCEADQASMAYFYFDFRNANKQSLRDLLPSLLTQLSARSSDRCDILSKLYIDNDHGRNQRSDGVLTRCLKDILMVHDQRPVYLIMDALDESPITSGIPSTRETVLLLLKELVDLGLPNLHICATSRPNRHTECY